MPKAVEDKLKKEASKKGLKGKHKAAYVFGTMEKEGLMPKSKKEARKETLKKKHKNIAD